jgi:hypothetical protein
MSSPTINVVQGSQDTSFLTIMNLVRDSQAGATATPGEGQVITDNPAISPFTLPFLNSAIRALYRELRNVGQPTLIKDNVIVSGLTPINSPTSGLGQSDPAVQVYLSTSGYFDGVSINPNILLPGDCIYPERLWERETGTGDVFTPMEQTQFGLDPTLQQLYFAYWEWRQKVILDSDLADLYGATTTRDLRLRYYCTLPTYFSSTLDFASTFVPIYDCTDAVAYKVAVMYARMLGSAGLPDLINESKEQMFQLKNATTRRAQATEYFRIQFGSYNGGTDQGSNSIYSGWQ